MFATQFIFRINDIYDYATRPNRPMTAVNQTASTCSWERINFVLVAPLITFSAFINLRFSHLNGCVRTTARRRTKEKQIYSESRVERWLGRLRVNFSATHRRWSFGFRFYEVNLPVRTQSVIQSNLIGRRVLSFLEGSDATNDSFFHSRNVSCSRCFQAV